MKTHASQTVGAYKWQDVIGQSKMKAGSSLKKQTIIQTATGRGNVNATNAKMMKTTVLHSLAA